MSCTVTDFGWQINGAYGGGSSCNATMSNVVQVTATINFSSDMDGTLISCIPVITYPDGHTDTPSSFFYAVAGSTTYTSDFTLTTTGSYTIDSYSVLNSAKTAGYCSTYSSGNGCNSLTIFATTPETVNVYCSDGGQVDIFRNDIYQSTVSNSNASLSYYENDTIKLQATANSGYSLNKFCTDQACSQSTTTNPFTATVTGPMNIYVYFTTSGGGGGGGITGYNCISPGNCQSTTASNPQFPDYNTCINSTQCKTGGGGGGTKYVCSNNCTSPITCPSGTTCYDTPSLCKTGCSTTSAVCQNDSDCHDPTKMCLFSSCYKKNDIYMAAGLLILMMMMK